MTNPQPDRLDRIETLLKGFIVAHSSEREASNKRMTRSEQRLEESTRASDERMTRVESGLERLEQATRSNNRFLESFSTDIRRYVDTMNNLATRIDGVIATNNQDRLEPNSRLQAIQRQVSAMPAQSDWRSVACGADIAKHLGVGNQ